MGVLQAIVWYVVIGKRQGAAHYTGAISPQRGEVALSVFATFCWRGLSPVVISPYVLSREDALFQSLRLVMDLERVGRLLINIGGDYGNGVDVAIVLGRLYLDGLAARLALGIPNVVRCRRINVGDKRKHDSAAAGLAARTCTTVGVLKLNTAVLIESYLTQRNRSARNWNVQFLCRCISEKCLKGTSALIVEIYGGPPPSSALLGSKRR